MEISLSTWMMLFFVLGLILSIWKVYAFLPNKELADDDKTELAENELTRLMLKIIKEKEGNLTAKELFFKMQEDEAFDSNLFWRFNQNRLHQLLQGYYIKNPDASCIEDIYKIINS